MLSPRDRPVHHCGHRTPPRFYVGPRISPDIPQHDLSSFTSIALNLLPSSHSPSASPLEWHLQATSMLSLYLRHSHCQAQHILSSTSSPQPNLILQTILPDQTATRTPLKTHASAMPPPKMASLFSLARSVPCRVALFGLHCCSLTCESRTCTHSTTNQTLCRRGGERFSPHSQHHHPKARPQTLCGVRRNFHQARLSDHACPCHWR